MSLEATRALSPPRLQACAPLWAEVHAAWTSPGRHYHTLQHLHEVARRWSEAPAWTDPEATFLAVLAHDAVYAIGAPDNEARSADLARQWARWLPGLDAERAARLVLATAHHHQGEPGTDPELDRFLDCDLAVLGAEPEAYDAYARGVRAEYLPLAGPDGYRAGRAAFLQGALQAPALFRSAWGRSRWEASARANLARELADLRDPAG